ncbi:LOW QUALITY PROTEIN: protein archease-like [Pollicipes pollicipes]|uniref:protein archease-like n=1 Tax=Pollicipes pollicipes TaxID=41117 RepID=UPI0018858C36|nr:protein archease-like [Pollicipes pollicipes]XP_037069507.1 LOW QUALITY PROTEIN: protein archease-like [Pollicipes pollicipes]
MPSPVVCDQEVSSTSSPPGVTAAPADSVTDAGGDAQPHSTSTGDQDAALEDASADECVYPATGYEYLDHPADVQLHAWGGSLPEAFEQAALAMFGYMTDLETVEAVDTQHVTAQGHDLESLLFHFLDEFLFLFSAEPFFVACHVEIVEFDRQEFRIRARGYGEPFDLDKHPQGTEVKAITYSNLQVHDNDDQHEVFVIIDI